MDFALLFMKYCGYIGYLISKKAYPLLCRQASEAEIANDIDVEIANDIDVENAPLATATVSNNTTVPVFNNEGREIPNSLVCNGAPVTSSFWGQSSLGENQEPVAGASSSNPIAEP